MNAPVTEAWPEDTLPLPFIDYSGKTRNATASDPIEGPFIERRSRCKQSYLDVQFNWELNQTQFDAFKGFVRDNLGLGATSFSIPLRHPKASSLTTWIVKFDGSYQSLHQTGRWKITANAELLRPLIIANKSPLV